MKAIDFTKPLQFSEASCCRAAAVKYLATDAGTGEIYVQHTDGTIGHYRAHELENVPEKITQWCNFYPSGSGGSHRTREQADRLATSERIACVPVTFEPGEGL